VHGDVRVWTLLIERAGHAEGRLQVRVVEAGAWESGPIGGQV
jgi:hypothetical protein